MIWFVKDSRGGWSELNLKLSNYDLELRVAKIPLDRSSLPGHIAELVQSCVKQGARDIVPLDKPLTYTEQVDVLKAKGLLGKDPAVAPDQVRTPTPEEEALMAAHRLEV